MVSPLAKCQMFGFGRLEAAAETRARRIYTALRAGRHDLEGRQHEVDGGLIPDQVHVTAARVGEPPALLYDSRRAGRIITVVDGRGARLDHDEARTRVRVPAGITAGSHGVCRHVHVGGPPAQGVEAHLVGGAQALDVDFRNAEISRAFVLMQYHGYLRRNPDDPPDLNFNGYDFWLNKLNQFGGDYRSAEMVKAFISSDEYKARYR